MNIDTRSASRTFHVGFLLVFTLCSLAHAEAIRTQTLSLSQGWNAVFLEVSPGNLAPSSVFSSAPVAIAATYVAADKSVEYISNPGAIKWKKEGWRVWYAANRPDAFLSNLQAVYGNRAYLIYARQNCTLNVTGAVTFEPTRWKSDSFNLTGFCLDDRSPPTFDQFFSGSSAHRPARIYRLVNDQWSLVTDPIRTSMRPGEAYWIFCRGRSDYQGPVTVKLPSTDGINFSSGSANWLSVANQSADPVNVQIERVSSSGDLPLAYTLRAITEGKMENASFDLPQTFPMPVLEPGASSTLVLTLRREQMTNPIQNTLLKVSTDSGVQFWIPVTGTQSSLSTSN